MSEYGRKVEVRSEDERIRRLEQRLNDGYELIEKRRDAGLDVSKLEDFWIELLHEYDAFREGVTL